MSETNSSPKVLMVDDDPSALFIYKTHLMRAGYRVVSASSVSSARQLLTSEKPETFSAVITDYWMPGATGFDLLRYIRQTDRTLAVILVTAEGEKEHVAQSLREGAHNFLDKPVSGPVLRDAAAKAIESTQRQRSLKATDEEAKALGLSQRLLLGRQSAAMQGRLRIFSRPHAQAGGDFAAAFPIGDHRIVVLVSDVSGHDLKAAYCSAYLQGIARGMLDQGASIEGVFKRINNLLLEDWNSAGSVELSLAACAVDIDLQKQTLTALNCGLPAPYIIDGDGWAIPLGEAKAHPLGWYDELPQKIEKSLSGGHLCFWSDGLEDVADRMGVCPMCLAYRLHQTPQEADALLGALATDDIVAVRIGLAARADTQLAPRVPLMAQIFSGAQATQIDTIQSFFERSLKIAMIGLPEFKLGDILLCLREAILNALVHGCQGKAERHALIQVSFDERSNCIHVRVTDDGVGHLFDFDQHEMVAAEDLIPEHRGLVLVKNLASRLHLSARGNRLAMDFPLGTP